MNKKLNQHEVYLPSNAEIYIDDCTSEAFGGVVTVEDALQAIIIARTDERSNAITAIDSCVKDKTLANKIISLINKNKIQNIRCDD